MRYYKDNGIVLKKVNSGEADKILTIFSRNTGKIRLKAKGSRRITSRRAGLFEEFNLINFSAVQGNQLDIITEVELLESFHKLKTDLMKVAIAYHFCELIDKLTAEEEPHKQLFEILIYHLQKLSEEVEGKNLFKETVIDFEVKLLHELGFGLPMEKTQRDIIAYIEDIIEKPLRSRKFLLQIAKG